MMSKRAVIMNFITLILMIVIMSLSYMIPMDKNTKLSLGYYKDSLLNFTELTKQYGYDAEVHDVTTEDGYILSLFHITKSKNCPGTVKMPPVLLMHGLLESADVFLDAGPKLGLGYLIPDHCFDLWIGNQRGNYYGRRHKHLDPDTDGKFWEFAAEEMSYYDIPGMIDYILNYTNSENLNFIGYSQGGANFFIMCSERPEYCYKTKLMIALAPAAFLANTRSTFLRILTRTAFLTRHLLEMLGINEILYKGSFFQEILEYVCQYTGTSITDRMCGTGGFADNYHPGSISYDTQKSLFGHYPAGTSMKNLARYSQIIASGKFQKYDYGETVNMEKYRSKRPPEFNLSAVTVPVVTVHGKNDLLTVIEDIKHVEDLLPNLVDAVKVANPLWTHLDIVYSQYSQEVIFFTVKKYLNKYSDEETCRVIENKIIIPNHVGGSM